jgi:hypothetical protein
MKLTLSDVGKKFVTRDGQTVTLEYWNSTDYPFQIEVRRPDGRRQRIRVSSEGASEQPQYRLLGAAREEKQPSIAERIDTIHEHIHKNYQPHEPPSALVPAGSPFCYKGDRGRNRHENMKQTRTQTTLVGVMMKPTNQGKKKAKTAEVARVVRLVDLGGIDDELFRKQRNWLARQPSCDEVEGLLSLLDHIYDALHPIDDTELHRSLGRATRKAFAKLDAGIHEIEN